MDPRDALQTAAQEAQAAHRLAPGKHPQTMCSFWLLAAKHVAVVTSKTCLSDLQLSSEQEEAQNQHLLFERMRQKVGLLTGIFPSDTGSTVCFLLVQQDACNRHRSTSLLLRSPCKCSAA